MRNILILLAPALLAASPAHAGPAQDSTAAVTRVLDKFNAGDTDAFFAAHEDGALIIDEFAPYVWKGPHSAQRWAAAYAQDASARGISGGRMDYGKPIQASSAGGSSYIVVPTTYRFVQKGRKMGAKGSMTFVMAHVANGWKIASWTYSGAAPTPQ